MICWQLKIPNLLYITGDPNTSLEEQLECAEKNDISLVIILKEKVIIRIRRLGLIDLDLYVEEEDIITLEKGKE